MRSVVTSARAGRAGMMTETEPAAPYGCGVLVATALRHALHGTVDVGEAASELAVLARGNTVLLEQAIARVQWALASRRSTIGLYALDALRGARALTEHPAAAWPPPTRDRAPLRCSTDHRSQRASGVTH